MTRFDLRASLGARPFAGLAALSLLVVASACTDLPKPRGGSVEATSPARLELRSPIEIAVAPVINESGGSVPTDALRAAFHEGLVVRRYSPLALSFVDKKVVDAAYTPGSQGDQAVLQVRVESWDSSLWTSRNAITAKLLVRLIDSESPEKGDLWTGRVDRRFEFTGDPEMFITDAARARHACDQIAREVLEALPARNPSPGYSSDKP